MKTTTLLVVLLSCLLSACSLIKSQFGGNHEGSLGGTRATPMVKNLVFALGQLDELPPIQTTLQIKPPVSAMGRTVLRTLTDAGYGLQLVDSDIGPHYVRYKFEEATTESGLVTRFSLSVGEMQAARDFVINNSGVLPDSSLEISGATEVFVELNDDIFEGKGSNYEADVVFVDSRLPELSESARTAILSASVDNTVLPASQTRTIKENVYETRQSNYAGLFSEYKDVESTVLIFGDESMRLGRKNKQVIADIASRMNPETDLVSVIGCSHGSTAINNGNSVLALGRANRVKEAFLYAGVDHSKVLEEGCWAPVYFEKRPSRGVVLTLKRLKGLNG